MGKVEKNNLMQCQGRLCIMGLVSLLVPVSFLLFPGTVIFQLRWTGRETTQKHNWQEE
jgi:hypothetical protein